MTAKGHQATFILPPEPQGDSSNVYTFVRKKGALSVEHITVRYNRHHKAYAVQYRPSAEGLIHQLSKALNLAQLTNRLEFIGFVPI